MRGFATVRPPQPHPEATVEEQLQHIHRWISEVEKELHQSREVAGKDLREVNDRLDERIDAVQSEVASAKRDVQAVRDTAFGREGRGLREAALGLAITLVGVLLSAISPLL